MDEERLNLLELVYGFAEKLMLSDDYLSEDILQFLDLIHSDIDAVRADYEEGIPEEARPVADLMLESLDLFDQAFQQVAEFLADFNEERLRKAVSIAEEADDLLTAVEALVTENKDTLESLAEVS